MADDIGTILISWLQSQSWAALLLKITIIIFVALLVKHYIIPYRTIIKTGLGGPIPKPFIGNVFDYGGVRQHIAQMKRQEKYGRIYALLHYHIPTIYVADPEMIKTIMIKEFANFTNRFPITKASYPFSKTVVRSDDQDWKRLRSLLVPSFSTAKLKSNIPLISDSCDDIIEDFLQVEQQGKVINVWKTFGKFTMNTIVATTFGLEFESKEQEDKIISATSALLRNQTNVIQFILIYAFLILALLEPLTGGKMIKSVMFLWSTIENVIKRRRKNINQGIPCRKDVLQHMIEAGEKDKLSNDEIISQALIFLIAGYETTASSLTFACYVLATNPDVQKKLIQEIDSKCPNEDSLNYEAVINLPYLDMVISETLRLYPPAFFITRQTRRDINLHDICIPNNAMIIFPIYAVHHNPELWPDPEKFIPERFTPEEKANRHPYSYIPFGGGPRMCIGMKLALLEVKLALAKLLHHVEFITAKETEIPLKLRTGSTTSPDDAVYLKIRRRH